MPDQEVARGWGLYPNENNQQQKRELVRITRQCMLCRIYAGRDGPLAIIDRCSD